MSAPTRPSSPSPTASLSGTARRTLPFATTSAPAPSLRGSAAEGLEELTRVLAAIAPGGAVGEGLEGLPGRALLSGSHQRHCPRVARLGDEPPARMLVEVAVP